MVACPRLSKTTGFVLRMVWAESCHVFCGVNVSGTYICTRPPTSGLPLMSSNCWRPFGTRLAGTCFPYARPRRGIAMLGDWVFWLGIGLYFGTCAKTGFEQGWNESEAERSLDLLGAHEVMHDSQTISEPHAGSGPTTIEHVSYRRHD